MTRIPSSPWATAYDFVAGCPSDANGRPPVDANSALVYQYSWTIQVLSNPYVGLTPPNGWAPSYVTYLVHTYADPAYAPAKNLNVVVLRTGYQYTTGGGQTHTGLLVRGWIPLPPTMDDAYFDVLLGTWMQGNLIQLLDDSVLTPGELNTMIS